MDPKDQLKQALDEIPSLRSSAGSREFDGWKTKVIKLLEQAYGKDSRESRRFAGAAGTTFRVGTSTGQQQDIDFQLDCYEDVLKSLVPKDKMF